MSSPEEHARFMRDLCLSSSQIPIDAVPSLLDSLSTIWCNNGTLCDMNTRNMVLFGATTNEDITVTYQRMVSLLEHITMLIDTKTMDNGKECKIRLDKVYTQISLGYEATLALLHQYRSGNESNRLTLPDGKLSSVFSRLDDVQDIKTHQQLLRLLTARIHQYGLLRHGSILYSRIVTEEGHDTYTYRPSLDIKEFVHREAVPNSQIWNMLTDHRGNIRMCVDYFTNCSQLHVPQLERTRGFFAFRNGILNGETCVFYSFPIADPSVLNGAICAVYHDTIYTDYGDFKLAGGSPLVIPTPAIDQILLSQGMGDGELFIFYALVGRMLFPTGKLDKWQAWPYFIGAGGCGKSTLMKQIEKIYDDGDVGHLESISPQEFAYQDLPGRYMMTVHDIDDRCNLKPTDLFVMISGEKVVIQRKFKSAITLDFDIQGAMGGNTFPPWPDYGGSAVRRLIIFSMPDIPENSAPDLIDRCAAERSNFIQKAVKCYKKIRSMHSPQTDIWADGVLPQSFHVNKMRMKACCNPLQAFVMSERCKREKDGITTFVDFKQSFHQFTRDERIKASSKYLSEESRKHIFKKFGIRMVYPSDRKHQSSDPNVPNQVYLQGISLTGEL